MPQAVAPPAPVQLRLLHSEAADPSTDFAPLFRALADLASNGKPLRFALEHCGRRVVVRVGESFRKTAIDASVAPLPPITPAAPRLSATTRRILRAVADLDAENPTANEIAEAAALPNESHFRKLLSSMRQEALFGGRKGEAGYPLTPKGLAALEG